MPCRTVIAVNQTCRSSLWPFLRLSKHEAVNPKTNSESFRETDRGLPRINARLIAHTPSILSRSVLLGSGGGLLQYKRFSYFSFLLVSSFLDTVADCTYLSVKFRGGGCFLEYRDLFLPSSFSFCLCLRAQQ